MRQLVPLMRERRKEMTSVCGNCGLYWEENELKDIWQAEDLHERVYPGEEFPAGECPSCGAFCHLVDPNPPTPCGSCIHEQLCAIRLDAIGMMSEWHMSFYNRSSVLDATAAIEQAIGSHCDKYKSGGK